MRGKIASNPTLALAGVLVVLSANAVFNVALDLTGRLPRLHMFLEMLTAVVGMAVAGVLWVGWRREAGARREAVASLAARRAERDAWRESARKALEGLGHAVDQQFEEWGLTPTEREIALLILKGHSHKRIAELTGRKERTVRQHGVMVYQKSGLSGRAGLAAHFLEDLMLPDQARRALQADPPGPPTGRGA